jgi:hypothetical protein
VKQAPLHITGLYALRRLTAAWHTKNRSRPLVFVRFFSGTFFCALETYGFLYRNCKNVAYNRNVMRHFGEFLEKIIDNYKNLGDTIFCGGT